MCFGEERERRTSALDIVSMSPPGYPSAWLHPCRARFRFTWRSHCSRVGKICKRCCRTPELPLAARVFQFAIAGGVNLGLTSGEHIVRRYMADGAVQAHSVVVIHVGLNQTHRIFPGQRCAGPDALRLEPVSYTH